MARRQQALRLTWPTTSATARPLTSTRTATVRPTVQKAAPRRRRGAARPDPQPRVPGLLHAQPERHEPRRRARRRETPGSGLAGHPRKRPDRGGAHALEHLADAGVAPASAPAPYAPLALPAAPWPPAAAARPAAAAPPWAPAPASAPAPWPPATSPRYRATDEALRRERALTFDESDGHAMKVDACDACPTATTRAPTRTVLDVRSGARGLAKCVGAAPSSPL